LRIKKIVGKITNMNAKATLLLRERLELTEYVFAELIIWRVPEPVKGSKHSFKYRLALVENGICSIRYDNEAGKGDHKHIGTKEIEYIFKDLETLQADFINDIERRLNQ
jgi:hypothetical protein